MKRRKVNGVWVHITIDLIYVIAFSLSMWIAFGPWWGVGSGVTLLLYLWISAVIVYNTAFQAGVEHGLKFYNGEV